MAVLDRDLRMCCWQAAIGSAATYSERDCASCGVSGSAVFGEP